MNRMAELTYGTAGLGSHWVRIGFQLGSFRVFPAGAARGFIGTKYWWCRDIQAEWQTSGLGSFRNFRIAGCGLSGLAAKT